MKKFLLAISLISATLGTHLCACDALCPPGRDMKITLPEPLAIKLAIRDAGFLHFSEISTLPKLLGYKKMSLNELTYVIQSAVNTYVETLQSPIASVQNGYDREAHKLANTWKMTILPAILFYWAESGW